MLSDHFHVILMFPTRGVYILAVEAKISSFVLMVQAHSHTMQDTLWLYSLRLRALSGGGSHVNRPSLRCFVAPLQIM